MVIFDNEGRTTHLYKEDDITLNGSSGKRNQSLYACSHMAKSQNGDVGASNELAWAVSNNYISKFCYSTR